MKKAQKYTEENRIVRGDDGVYRWIYELNLFKNPVILFVIWKILVFSLIGVWFFVVIISIGERDFFPTTFLKLSKVFALLIAVMLIIGLIAYLLYAAVIGGKYCVLFEMDDKGIKHTQLPGQFKKAALLSDAAVLLGLASGNLTAAGSGLISKSRYSITTNWSKVKSISVHPKINTIKVNELLNKNQVYVSDKEFEFVRHFIEEHCVNAKIYK